MNGKRVYLHRHIFETHVRPLKEGEIVHHKNENKRDNRIENLEAVADRAEHLLKHGYFLNNRYYKHNEQQKVSEDIDFWSQQASKHRV